MSSAQPTYFGITGATGPVGLVGGDDDGMECGPAHVTGKFVLPLPREDFIFHVVKGEIEDIGEMDAALLLGGVNGQLGGADRITDFAACTPKGRLEYFVGVETRHSLFWLPVFPYIGDVGDFVGNFQGIPIVLKVGAACQDDGTYSFDLSGLEPLERAGFMQADLRWYVTAYEKGQESFQSASAKEVNGNIRLLHCSSMPGCPTGMIRHSTTTLVCLKRPF